MKKNYSLIFVFLILISLVACSEKNIKFQSGRDTFASFGNGEFQILRISIDRKYIFFDEDKKKIIESNVYSYYDNNPFLYITGTQGYSIINYKTGEIKQKSDLNKLEDKEKQMFEVKDKFKSIKDNFK